MGSGEWPDQLGTDMAGKRMKNEAEEQKHGERRLGMDAKCGDLIVRYSAHLD